MQQEGLTCQVETSVAILDRLLLASAAPPMICMGTGFRSSGSRIFAMQAG